MSDATKLGLTCPGGGDFYTCTGNTTEFVGCCKSNPCADGSGSCPTKDLTAASFDSDRYANIPAQSCDDARGANIWYTCAKNSPPFMGCCASDPCAEGFCPQYQLVAAKLSTDANSRAVFTNISSSAPSKPQQTESHGLSTGAIAGIAVGAAIIVIGLVAFMMYRCGWLARKRREMNSPNEAHPAVGYEPVMHDAYRGSYHTRGGSGTYAPSSYHGSPMAEEFQNYKHHSAQLSPPLPGYNPSRPISSITNTNSWQSVGSPGYYNPLYSPDPNMQTFPAEVDGTERKPNEFPSEIDGTERPAPVSELAANDPAPQNHNAHAGGHHQAAQAGGFSVNYDSTR